jgi:hypothetical protein
MPDVTRRTDGTIAIDYGSPGPFIVLTVRQLRALIIELGRQGIIADTSYPRLPAS